MKKISKKENPVPSLDNTVKLNIQIIALTKEEIPYIVKELDNNLSNNSWGFEYKLKVLQNGVETNNEQPKICPTCNINPATTAKGLCEVCDPYW